MTRSTAGWWLFFAPPVLGVAMWLLAGCAAPESSTRLASSPYPVYTVTPSPTSTWTPPPRPTLTPTPSPAPGAVGVTSTALTTSRFTLRDVDQADSWQLSELAIIGAAALSGWDRGLWDALVSLATCESHRWAGETGDNGYSLGLLQVRWSTWFPYALELGLVSPAEGELWDDPVVNFKVGLAAFLYDAAVGNPPFAQWTCSAYD